MTLASLSPISISQFAIHSIQLVVFSVHNILLCTVHLSIYLATAICYNLTSLVRYIAKEMNKNDIIYYTTT